MFKLDDNLLQELGLGALPPSEKNRMLNFIYEKLEERVGMNLASQMSDEQLSEFEQLMPVEGDTPEIIQQKERAALQWLETNFPNYKQVVANELEKLKLEIRQMAPQILASVQASMQQAPQMPPQAPPAQNYQPPQPPQNYQPPQNFQPPQAA